VTQQIDHPGVRKVAAALTEAGLAEAAAGIRILDAEARTAAQAAAALGIEVGAIANSLVFTAIHSGPDGAAGTGTEERPLLALTSGAHRADLTTLAALAGATEVRRADPEFVRRHTGQAIGGVAPIGHPAPVLTIVDRELAGYPVVWAAAGHPKSVFPTTFDELVTLTGGIPADVAGAGADERR
jgi:prolyl-tRNA editing enzyme YbaK/EbsC (Cys-tRNA(Pro) deacylase)